MKDVEVASLKGDQASGHASARDRRKKVVLARTSFTPKQILTYISASLVIIAVIFGIGALAAACERAYNERDGVQTAQDGDTKISETGPQLTVRAVQIPGVLRVEDMVPDAEMTTTAEEEDGVRIPISTQTELSTLYSFSPIVSPTSRISDAHWETECTPSVITETRTAIVTVTVSPLPSSSGDGYVTVSDDLSTVTEDRTYLTGPTVITVSGEPSTVTDVQTDVSYTSGLPDATVSGDPSTLTDIQTSISITEELPDVTVTNAPGTVTETDISYSLITSASSIVTVVITDLWDPEPTTTVTSVATSQVTVTTVETSLVETVTDYLPPPGESSSTLYSSEAAKGEGQTRTQVSITATVVVDPPFPTNVTATYPAGTITNVPGPATPVIISGSPKKPEPKGWGTNGTGAMTCTVMLVAVAMCLL